jgi:hypothetical protein
MATLIKWTKRLFTLFSALLCLAALGAWITSYRLGVDIAYSRLRVNDPQSGSAQVKGWYVQLEPGKLYVGSSSRWTDNPWADWWRSDPGFVIESYQPSDETTTRLVDAYGQYHMRFLSLSYSSCAYSYDEPFAFRDLETEARTRDQVIEGLRQKGITPNEQTFHAASKNVLHSSAWATSAEVGVPLWMIAVFTGLPPGTMVFRRYRRIARLRRRSRLGLCRDCGYDLRGAPGRCPECGSDRQCTDASPVATNPQPL